jgi:hypothetical protein
MKSQPRVGAILIPPSVHRRFARVSVLTRQGHARVSLRFVRIHNRVVVERKANLNYRGW